MRRSPIPAENDTKTQGGTRANGAGASFVRSVFRECPRCVTQQGQRLFKLHTVPVRLRVAGGDVDAGQREAYRQRGGLLQRKPPHHAAYHRGGEDVAGAVEGAALPPVKAGEVCVGAAVVAHGAQLVRRKGHAGEHHALCAQRRHAPQQFPDEGLVHLLAVGCTGEETRLRQVGDGHIGLRHHLRHDRGEVRPEAGVELSVIGHCGIYEDHGVGGSYGVEEIQHLLHLPGGGDIAGVQRVEVDVLGAPVGGDSRQLVGQVAADEAGEGGVGAENRRGYDGALHAQRGDHRQRHGQGAAPQTGDILNGCDTFHGGIPPFRVFLVRAAGLEPARLTAMEPKGDVTLVKDFKNPKYLQSSAPSHPLSTLPLNAGR